MESALKLIPARTELLALAGTGHELITKSNREDLIKQVTTRFPDFTGITAQ
jgi:hypothetical protein